MKKVFFTIVAFLFVTGTAFANIGISVQGLYFDASGTETLKESSNKPSKDESGVAPIASLFFEGEAAGGRTIGLEVVPYGAKLGDGGMTSDDDAETSGTNTVDVNFKNMISLYLENPVDTNLDGSFIRAAVTHVTLETDETVNTGSEYGDENLQGLTLGFGVKRDMPTGDGFYKIIGEISHFTGATFNSSNTANKIELDDFQTASIRLSLGF